LDSVIAQSEGWSQWNAQWIAESKRKTTSLFGWFWSQSEFRTQRVSPKD